MKGFRSPDFLIPMVRFCCIFCVGMGLGRDLLELDLLGQS